MLHRSRKLSRSGYKITDLYSELESALIAQDAERACCLTAELSCTTGGHTRAVVSFLLDSYCARCVNSCRAQLNLLGSSLAHLGDGTTKSPDLKSCLDPIFRRGLCTLTLLVTCGVHPTKNVTARFACVPRSQHVSSLDYAILELRKSIVQHDAHSMSSVIRAIPDETWFSNYETASRAVSGMPDVQRLRAHVRREAVWELWALARQLSQEVGVSEYVDISLKAFAWGYCSKTRKSRVHLLWYAFLVIIKKAPRGGPHLIPLDTFTTALKSIDTLYDDILCKTDVSKNIAVTKTTSPIPHLDPTKNSAESTHVTLDAPAVPLDVDDPLTTHPSPQCSVSYLYTILHQDPAKCWEVEKDRDGARNLCQASADTTTRCIDISRSRRSSQRA